MKLECSRCGQPFEDYQTAEMEIHAKNRHSRQGQASDNLDIGPVEWVPQGTYKSAWGETNWGRFIKDFVNLDNQGLDVHDLLELQKEPQAKSLTEVSAGDWKEMTMEERRLVLVDNGFEEYIRFNSNKDYADLHPMIKYKLGKDSRLEQDEAVSLEYKKLLE